jgi:copper homeostasis protein
MNQKVLIEVCCGSVDDAIIAQEAGADRIELNSCLFEGGLTPSLGSFLTAKEKIDIPIMVMVRPRGAGFYYTEAEFESMLKDAEIFAKNGADGIVFGFLNEDGTINYKRCREMLNAVGDKESVFHRAIDVVPDCIEAVSKLADLGVDRILTSGQEPSSFEGVPMIHEMVKAADGKIEILPGGGVRKTNVAHIVEQTGVTQVHFAGHGVRMDSSTGGNTKIFFGGALYPPEDRHKIADCGKLTSIIEASRK